MTDLITEDMTVPSEPGIDIFVRNKRPANLTAFTPERTLLFVHGSTYPAHTGFDIPLGGQSWMESIASHGYDVYCLDVRGYGRSTRPAAMDEPPQNNPPVTRTPDAVNDITAVLNFILKRRNTGKLNLLGWSWGCTMMATTAMANPDKVARLMRGARAVVVGNETLAAYARAIGACAVHLVHSAVDTRRIGATALPRDFTMGWIGT
ncbi:MAG: alpha/beta fold hydrolase, partial [Hyphomicrobiales bacterium]